MVGGQHDQRVLESDLLVDESEQVGEGAVQLQDDILVLETGGSEKMVDGMSSWPSFS